MDGHHSPEAALRAAGAREGRFTPELPARGMPFGRLRVLTLADATSAPLRHYLVKGLIAQVLAKVKPHRPLGRHNAGA
jgi:hypothetical protein